MLLQPAIDMFLGTHRPTTRDSYKYCLRDFVGYIGATRPLADISPSDILRYAAHLDSNPAIKSPASYNKYLKTLRTFFNWCVRADFIDKTPILAVKYRRTAHRIPRNKAFPEEALQTLLEYTRWDPRADALVRFLADTGCRIGGAASLQEQDLDLDHRTGTVIEKGKADPRPIFYGQDCANAIRRWLLSRSRAKKGRYVFSSDGHRMGNEHLAQYFRRICERAGIGSYGPHSLRHRKGHQLADNRIAPSLAAQALGHDDVSITLTYYYPRDWDRVASVLSDLSMDSPAARKTIPIPRKKSASS